MEQRGGIGAEHPRGMRLRQRFDDMEGKLAGVQLRPIASAKIASGERLNIAHAHQIVFGQMPRIHLGNIQRDPRERTPIVTFRHQACAASLRFCKLSFQAGFYVKVHRHHPSSRSGGNRIGCFSLISGSNPAMSDKTPRPRRQSQEKRLRSVAASTKRTQRHTRESADGKDMDAGRYQDLAVAESLCAKRRRCIAFAPVSPEGADTICKNDHLCIY